MLQAAAFEKKNPFIDDEATEADTEEDSGFENSDEEIDTARLEKEDEDFIVEVVARRFGLRQLDSDCTVTVTGPPGSLATPSSSCWHGVSSSSQYSCRSSVERDNKSSGSGSDSGTSDRLGLPETSSKVRGGSSGSRGKRRKVVPQAALKSLVSTSLSGRVQSALKKAVLPVSTEAVSTDAVPSVRLQASSDNMET